MIINACNLSEVGITLPIEEARSFDTRISPRCSHAFTNMQARILENCKWQAWTFRLNCFSYWCHCCLKAQKSHQTWWIIENLIWVWIKLRQILGHDCQTLFLIQILFIINQQILISCLFSYKNIHFPPALLKCFENSQVGSMDLPGHNEPHRIWTFFFSWSKS